MDASTELGFVEIVANGGAAVWTAPAQNNRVEVIVSPDDDVAAGDVDISRAQPAGPARSLVGLVSTVAYSAQGGRAQFSVPFGGAQVVVACRGISGGGTISVVARSWRENGAEV